MADLEKNEPHALEPRFEGDDLRPQGLPAATAVHDHERKDISLSGILWFGAILALVIVGVQFLLAYWIGFYSRGEDRAAKAAPPRFADATDLYPAPRIQGDPTADMQNFLAAEEKALDNYGAWRPINPADPKSARVVRLPIDRAIELTVRKSQGGAPKAAPAPSNPNPTPNPETAPPPAGAAAKAEARPE
jgi:hypothetical protein